MPAPNSSPQARHIVVPNLARAASKSQEELPTTSPTSSRRRSTKGGEGGSSPKQGKRRIWRRLVPTFHHRSTLTKNGELAAGVRPLTRHRSRSMEELRDARPATGTPSASPGAVLRRSWAAGVDADAMATVVVHEPHSAPSLPFAHGFDRDYGLGFCDAVGLDNVVHNPLFGHDDADGEGEGEGVCDSQCFDPDTVPVADDVWADRHAGHHRAASDGFVDVGEEEGEAAAALPGPPTLADELDVLSRAFGFLDA